MRRHVGTLGMVTLCATSGMCFGETVALFPTEIATIQGTTDAGETEARLLVRFDLGVIPQEVLVTDASLFLDGVVFPYPNGWICLYAAPMTSGWDPESVTWDGPSDGAEWNSPGGDWEFATGDYGCWGDQVSGGDTEESQYSPRLNITTLVIEQLSAPETQRGFILFPSDMTLLDVDAADVELAVLRQLKPRLVVGYEPFPDTGQPKPALQQAEKRIR